MRSDDRDLSWAWEALLSGTTAADAKRLAERCVREPAALAAVEEASAGDHPVTRAHAFHVFKQVATLRSDLLDPYRNAILDFGREGEYWTIPLLAAQAVSRMKWPADWHGRVIEKLEPYLDGSNKFAAAWALRALWPLAEPGAELQRTLHEACARFLAIGGAPAASARILMRHPNSGGKQKA